MLLLVELSGESSAIESSGIHKVTFGGNNIKQADVLTLHPCLIGWMLTMMMLTELKLS
jgi:hypothetical protein